MVEDNNAPRGQYGAFVTASLNHYTVLSHHLLKRPQNRTLTSGLQDEGGAMFWRGGVVSRNPGKTHLGSSDSGHTLETWDKQSPGKGTRPELGCPPYLLGTALGKIVKADQGLQQPNSNLPPTGANSSPISSYRHKENQTRLLAWRPSCRLTKQPWTGGRW